ncbi:MAG TPA: hypothetical protein VGI38_08380 [Puia sp.]
MRKLYLIVLILSISCRNNKANSIKIGENRIEGNITSDTIFNGLIKIYDVSNRLLSEGYYIDGIKNGEYKQYYETGAVNYRLFYSDGKENGFAEAFNKNGDTITKDFYYYGLRTGNAEKYEKNKLKSYSFLSLDNRVLIYFDYDSLKRKQLPDLFHDFFFFTVNSYFPIPTDTSLIKREYFLYTPNPPMQEFIYSLVRVNKSLKVLATMEEFDKNKPWSKFESDSSWNSSYNEIAIKLRIIDTINGNNITMIKVLR